MGELTLWQKIRWKLRERAKKPLRENIWDLLTSWPKIKYRLREYRQRSVRTTINSFGLFDGDWYLLNNADVRISGADPLTHYMRHGFAEGRSPGPNGIAPAAFRATRFGHPDQAGSGKPLGDEAIQEIAMASLFEPSIGDFRQISHTLMPPDHDPVAKAERAMRALIPADHYDTILCVPWLRQGGADLVASLMAASLLRIFPQQSVLILRTDFSHFERPDWIPEGTTVVDISPILTPIGIEAAERLLYSLFIGLAPRRIVNINSRRCWTTLKRFGRQLVERMGVFAYLFCWEIDTQGIKQGYPREFYPTTGPLLTGIFTDTEFLREDLGETYSLPALERNRIIPIFSPTREPIALPSMAERRSTNLVPGARPLVLWAGRLDRQKRFDLVLAIAAQMPDVDFKCWGSALLDASSKLSNLPSNLSLSESFKSLDELPLDRCDAWLFTSGWEGLPTLLIDLGAKGVPIVASAVGGVPELITPDTGWPITDIENIADYVSALRFVIAHPEIGCQRAKSLQSLVGTKHSQAAYDMRLSNTLDIH